MQFGLAFFYGLELIWKIYAWRLSFFRDQPIIFILEIPFQLVTWFTLFEVIIRDGGPT